MLSWLAKRLITYVMAQTRAGNLRPTLLLDSPEVTMRFPGDNSWSGTYRGKQEVKAWLERLVRVGVMTEPDEVALSGWPWRMTIAIRGRSWFDTAAGERIYDNRFVIWGHLRWGRLVDYETYEDTIKPRVIDDYLERTAGTPGRAAAGLSAAPASG